VLVARFAGPTAYRWMWRIDTVCPPTGRSPKDWNTLRWKKTLLDESVREGTVGRFLKFANAILGSLAKVIPPLEIVK
jgi:hypothetical protein